MNIDDIQVGMWYKISCKGSPEVAYAGIGMVTYFNPTGYPENTFEVLCENNEFGYFSAEHFVSRIPLPDQITMNTMLLFMAQNRENL